MSRKVGGAMCVSDDGASFDDGVFDGVKKITVGGGVSYMKIEYEKDGKVEIREHGTNRGELKEFEVDYPNDNIMAVCGSHDTRLITSLYFRTSRGNTSPIFGKTNGTDFVFEDKNGGKLLGFHGRAGHSIVAIGAFFETTKTDRRRFQQLSLKLGPLGGNEGETFDDGLFDGVKTVSVGTDEYSVTYIKIEYDNGEEFETREHGTKRGEIKEFSVDYPNDYIETVGGSHDTRLITSLYFKTSKGINSPVFGEKKGADFKLEGENGGKLRGFHGRGGDAIDAIGVHVQDLSVVKKLFK